jgi:ATP-dependent DNA helicase RecQ
MTPLGIEVMKGAQPPPPALDDLIPRRVATPTRVKSNAVTVEIDLAPEAARRFEKLRIVRMQLARDRQLPPYCICHDSTLKLIAAAPPADADALELVKGMGPMKVKLYGQAILGAVNQD